MSSKIKHKKRMRQTIGNLLLWIGALMITLSLSYEAFNYPWRHLLQGWGWLPTQVDLPNPIPISNDWATTEKTTESVGMLPKERISLTKPPVHLEMLGIIKLPQMSISENIVEGCNDQLCYAVGHVQGTAFPGQEGNCVLGGHRNYIPMHPFRYLDMLKTGDSIILQDKENEYTYEVFESFVVKPTDIWILDPLEGEKNVVTLFTCTPVLTMTDRLVVRGRLISQVPLEKEVLS